MVAKIMIIYGLVIICVMISSSAISEKENNNIPVGVIVDMESWVGKAVNSCISMAFCDFYSLNEGYKTRIDLHSMDSNGDHLQALSAAISEKENNNIPVGVIVDMGSWVGKAVNSCISMAFSDFYSLNEGYKTRIDLHSMDSNGDHLQALSAVHHLLNKVKVQAILVLETSLEGKLLALFADKAKVPFFSFARIPSSTQEPYLFQITPDETIMFMGIASLVESYKLTNVIVLYEDTYYASETMPSLAERLNEKNIVITYSSDISHSSSHDQFFQQLGKVKAVGTTTVIMHMSTSLASTILLHAKNLRMVNLEYTWIITDNAQGILHSLGSEAIKSKEGSLSLKPYIPASQQLHTFISRWKKEFDRNYPTSEAREMSVLGILAYDVIWALAECVEKARNRTDSSIIWKEDVVSLNGPILANEISQIRFKGLSGQFQLRNGKLVSKALEIVEVRGLGEIRVGFWTLSDGIMKDIHPSSKSSYPISRSGIDDTHWSEGSTTMHNRKMSQTTDIVKKLKIAVPLRRTFPELVSVEQDLETNTTRYNGFCIDVFKAAMTALPYDYEFVTFQEPDGQSSASYDQLIDQVYYQKYDGAVADITILAYRSKKVDFTLTYTDLGIGTIARTDHKDMWIFFKPLGAFVWLATAACFAVVGSIVWLFEHPINEQFQGSAAQQIGTTLWFAFMTIFFAQRERLYSSWAKFIVGVWLFILLILIASYTAILSSLLTVQQIQIASKGQFIGYHGDSFLHRVINNNMNFSDYRLRQYKTCQDYADALSRGSKRGGVEAIIDEIPYLKIFLAQYSVGYAMVASESTSNGFGFAFQKGSLLVHDLSLEIAKLREDGTLVSLEKKWFKSSSDLTSPDSTNSNHKILNFGDLSGLFLIGAVAFGLALGSYAYKFVREKIHIVNDYTY